MSKINLQHRIFYGSSYDRGLEHLLKMWNEIRGLTGLEDVSLHIAYGWDLFDIGYRDNPERMAWKERMIKLMKQSGVTEYGRLGKVELEKLRKSCGVWAYPCHFTEINCITALEAQASGLVPVTMDLGALKETVGSGILITGDIYDEDVRKVYLEGLIKVLSDTPFWLSESKKAREHARSYSWTKISQEWLKHL